LLKIQEANVLLAEQQEALDRLRNEVAGELETWRQAAEERLLKLQEANVLLGEQQTELDRLRNELAGERQTAHWLASQSAVFEKAAAERLALLEKTALPG
jgi:hypothetical protein